ncbi:7605_t:CDS:1 [Diversispora eburnea]|uniref:7605_t:CDS:1 n=1 Tax=Diversispora eburnea TaxID=1213867 RepID=A0A9N8ZPZ6_9GLOM|nr:7605_t:CDS:1 [Diversispora eburnea]
MNPPLYAAILALIIGITRPLKVIFFGDNAPLAVFTQSIEYIGTITIPLTLMALGAQLANLPTRSKGGKSLFPSIGYILICRFLVMPLIGIILVLLTKNWFVQDPMLWFILMLLASGPTAVNCLNLAYLNKSFEEEMATLLFYSYMALAPFITIIVMGMLSIIGNFNTRSHSHSL